MRVLSNGVHVTAFGDYVAVAAAMPTGFGPTVWVGELRFDGQPIREHVDGTYLGYPMSLGRTADEVFDGLQTRADRLTGAAA